MPTCDDGVVPSQGACIKKEMDDAWADYEQSMDNLDTVQIQAAKAVAKSESAVTRAEQALADAQETLDKVTATADSLAIEAEEKQLALARASLDQAKADLDKLTNGLDPLEVEVNRKQVALTQANLDQARVDLDKLTDGLDPLEAEAKRKQVALAQANRDQAKADLATLTNGLDPLEVEAKRRQVAIAQASLEKAEEDLTELQLGVEPLEIALLAADVAAARASLETAIQRFESATLEAPWNGIVSIVNVEPDQPVNANTPALEIVDPSVVEVDGVVDEIDVLFIREGARAEVTMDALPGQALAGTVSAIAATAQNQQGVVSYPIRIRVATPQGVQLPEGLSAVASVIIREELDVLLVPLQSLYGTFEQPVVRVMSDGRIEERAVLLGNSDDFWAVVESGLVEGELVAMESQQATTGGFGFGSFGGGFGGGRGGGRDQARPQLTGDEP